MKARYNGFQRQAMLDVCGWLEAHEGTPDADAAKGIRAAVARDAAGDAPKNEDADEGGSRDE